MLKAGVCQVDISPEKGVGLAGYPHCPRPNKGVHDPLYAACIYLNNGKDEIVFVTLDLLYFGKQYVQQIRSKFTQKIMFTATHTHSGPWASELLASEKEDGIRIDEAYMASLLAKLESAIREAISNPFDAKIATAVGHCGAEAGVGGNRRDLDGPCDPTVNVLAVSDLSGEVRGILVNYALHPTYLHSDNELCSADYPAYIRRYFHFAYKNAVVLFAQGTSGNQSSRYFRVAQNFEEAARVGTTIACEAHNVIRDAAFTDQLSLTIRSKEIELPMKAFPNMDEAKKLLYAAQEEVERVKEADYLTRWNASLALYGAQNAVTYARLAGEHYTSPELPCEVMTVILNDTAIVGIQGEIFVEYGLAIKELSPHALTFVFEVTNGTTPGYVYTKQAYIDGGYEVGTSMLAPDAGDAIINTVKELL